MKVSETYSDAPPLPRWVQALVEDGWHVIEHGADEVVAQRQIGEFDNPTKNDVTWTATVRETRSAVIVEVEVPVYCKNEHSKRLLDEKVEEIASASTR